MCCPRFQWMDVNFRKRDWDLKATPLRLLRPLRPLRFRQSPSAIPTLHSSRHALRAVRFFVPQTFEFVPQRRKLESLRYKEEYDSSLFPLCPPRPLRPLRF